MDQVEELEFVELLKIIKEFIVVSKPIVGFKDDNIIKIKYVYINNY